VPVQANTAVLPSDAGTIFGQGGQNRERQIDGIVIEFGPRFCPRDKRSLKKKALRRIWTAFFVPELSVLFKKKRSSSDLDRFLSQN